MNMTNWNEQININNNNTTKQTFPWLQAQSNDNRVTTVSLLAIVTLKETKVTWVTIEKVITPLFKRVAK